MTTRARATPAEARERILQTASDLFYKEGIRAVGIDTIIAKAGVAKMTLYNHFASKDELVVEFLKRRDERWMASFRESVEQRTKNPQRRLLAVFDALEEWFQSDDFRGCAFINAAAELADRHHPAHKVALEHKARLRAFILDLAKAAEVPSPKRLADRLFLLVEGAIVTALMEGNSDSARQARQAATALLLSSKLRVT
jgi:AcrR family transcriptional regulator